MTTQEYFYALNYTLANEDTEFEYDITQALKPKKIISVCGSGSRAIPLITSETQELILVDLSKYQLMLAALRVEATKEFSFDEFLLFWGYPPFKSDENNLKRKELFEKLHLDLETSNYFKGLFEYHQWNSILYIGKWEKTFKFFSKVVRKIMGEKVLHDLFNQDTLSDQQDYIKTKFPKLKWKLIMSILGNKSLFNALLYKGDFIKKNVDESYIQYYDQAFNHLMNHDMVKKSFFMQLCFLGEIQYQEGNLIEAREAVFKKTKKNLKNTKVTYLEKDIISAIKDEKDVDYVSLSDVPSYFSDELEKNFFQMLKPGLSDQAIVVNRNYLRIPNANRSGYTDITETYQEALLDEKVQMYRIEVLKNEL